MELFNENSKLAAVIHKDHSLLPVINRLGVKLGFGDQSIRNLCEEKGIDLNFFVEIINVFHYEAYFPEKRLLDFPVSMVIDYLVRTHQYYKNYLIPENDRLIELFLSANPDESTENELVRKFYTKFNEEFVIHINFEERAMFPYILELSEAIENPVLRNPFRGKYPGFSITGYEKEHSNMDEKMDDLKNIIIKYLPPNYDQNRGNAFLANLFMFDKDLKNHSRIEDHILIPKVKQLEKVLLNHE
ncbi:MAG TPA: hemerythrin domain-containing protein [Prolixibacteraceae bacterium]|nr:hemerythrin domain-containing protein [Prolixibacteraceae bacterium]